jgi:hypothetical protein
MGCDHEIIVGFGYRIPISKWNAFKNSLHERQLRSKKIKVQRNGNVNSSDDESEYDDTFIDAEWEIGAIEGCCDTPKTHGFTSQGHCLTNEEEGYVFIYNIKDDHNYLMSRKIGGALSWLCTGFEHMQNISTLIFSIKLQHDFEDWKLESGEWEQNTQKRIDFVNGLPQCLKEFIETLSVTEYYNQWLFSCAC